MAQPKENLRSVLTLFKNVRVVARIVVGALLEIGKGVLKNEIEIDEAVDELIGIAFNGLLEG